MKIYFSSHLEKKSNKTINKTKYHIICSDSKINLASGTVQQH